MNLLSIAPQLLYIYGYDRRGVMAGVAVIIVLVVIAIGAIPRIFYLLTLQNTLKVVAPQNRKMRPGQVWLQLIPFFSIVWQFIVVDAIAASIAQEYKSRGMPVNDKPAYNIGIAAYILNCCYIVLVVLRLIFKYALDARIISGLLAVLIVFVAIAFLAVWIIYWVKVSEYKNKIQMLPPAPAQGTATE